MINKQMMVDMETDGRFTQFYKIRMVVYIRKELAKHVEVQQNLVIESEIREARGLVVLTITWNFSCFCKVTC